MKPVGYTEFVIVVTISYLALIVSICSVISCPKIRFERSILTDRIIVASFY